MKNNYFSTHRELKQSVMKRWQHCLALLFGLLLSVNSTAQVIEVGQATSTSSIIPVSTFWGYSYSQQIILKEQINHAGNITKIRFNFVGEINFSSSNHWIISVGTTNLSTFANSTSWISGANLTQVYNGTLFATTTPGWYDLTFDTPYPYDNESNLVIAVQEKKSGYNTSTAYINTYTNTANRTIYYRNDTIQIDPLNITQSGTTTNASNHIGIEFESSVAPDCSENYLPADGATEIARNPRLSWVNNSGASSYDLYFGTTSPPPFIANQEQTNYITNQGLLANTTYYWKVVAKNNNGEAVGCTEQSFTTSDYLLYCPSLPTSNDGLGITNLSIGANSFTIGDVFYVDLTSQPIDVYSNIVTPSKITFGTSVTYNVNIWVDLNENGVYETAELLYSGESITENPNVLISNFTIPTGYLGTYHMRIGTADSGQATPNPCYNGSYGVTLDLKINILEAPLCTAPTGLAINSLSDSQASISFNADEGTSFEYVLGESTDNSPFDLTPQPIASTGLTFEVNDLNPNTSYKLWVRAICGNTPSPWTDELNIRTLCQLETEFTQNFEAETTGASGTFPTCWSKRGTGSTYIYTPNSSYSKRLYMYTSATTNAYAIMPAVSNLSDNTHRLKFKAYASAANKSIEIGYFAIPNDLNSFTLIDSKPITSTSPDQIGDYSVVLGSIENLEIPSNVYSLVFKNNGPDINGATIYIDEVVWEAIPACIELAALNVSDIKTSSVKLSWTSQGNETQWQYAIGTTEESADDLAPITIESDDNTFVVENLDNSTTFKVWMRALCANGSTSEWSDYKTFTTLTPGQVGTGTLTSTIFPVNSYNTYNYSQQIVLAQELEAALEPNSPYITKLRFKQTEVGTTVDKYNKWKIYIANTEKSSFANLTDYIAVNDLTEVYSGINTGLSSTGWVEFNLITPFVWDESSNLVIAIYEDAPSYTSSGYSAKFAVYNGGTGRGIIRSSDVNFTPQNITTATTLQVNVSQIQFVSSEIPNCTFVEGVSHSNISNNTATISWEHLDNNYVIEYASEMFESGNGNIINNIEGSSYTLPNLDANTKYFYYVKRVCGNEESSPSGPFSFTTLCDPTTDFEDNFDSYTSIGSATSPLPDCWSRLGDGTVYISSGAVAPSSPANRLQIYAAAAATAYAVMPNTYNINDDTHRLSFRAFSTSSNKKLEIGYFEDSSDLSTFQLIDTVDLTNTAASAKKFFVYPSQLNTTQNSLVFRNRVEINSGTTIYIDDVAWEPIPSCREIEDLVGLNPQAHTANISWTTTGNETAWQYAIGTSTEITATTQPDDLSIYDITGTETQALIENLSPVTTYKLWLRANCGNNQSDWSDPITFTTLCAPYTPTYVEDFATFPPSCWSRAAEGDDLTGPIGTAAGNWVADGFLNVGTTGAARINIYSTDRKSWLISPTFDLSEGGYQLSFDYGLTLYNSTTASQLGSDDVVMVLMSEDAGNEWVTIKTFNSQTNISNTSTNYAYEIDSESDNVKFAFYSTSGTVNDGIDNDFFIDNFTIETTPTCLIPTGLNVSSVSENSITVSWNQSETAVSGYEVYYSTESTNPDDSVNGEFSSSNTFTINNLETETSYYIWVRTVCEVNNLSRWSLYTTGYTGYCAVSTTNTSDYTSALSITTPSGTLSYSATSQPSGSYVNNTSQVIEARIGETINFSHTYVGGQNSVSVWVDWDNNLVFNNATSNNNEKIFYQGTSSASVNGTFTVNENTPIGEYRLRLRSSYLSSSTPAPCGSISYGSTIDYTLSISEALNNNDFDLTNLKVYPNPVKDILNLSYSKNINTVEVYNLLGQKVMTKMLNTQQATLDMSQLSTGTYLIKLQSESETKTVKIIKQ